MKIRKINVAFALFCYALSLQAQTNQSYLSYIAKYKDLAIEQMEIYNIPASITLAQGLLESGAGKSELSLKSNNHFGIKCGSNWKGKTTRHDDDSKSECFRVYKDVRSSYEDHSKFLRGKSRYASLFQLLITDYKGWATGLKKAGYATNPQYANRLINIIETYKLYLFDTKAGVKVREPEKVIATKANSTREVKLNNGILMIMARSGETIKEIAQEFDIKPSKIIKYNDFYSGYSLESGEWVYLQKKKARASRDYSNQVYIIKSGDSMHSISQAFGIRLNKLYKMNKMKPAHAMPQVGTPIRIR